MSPVTIAIDARTFEYEESNARGIGHYSRRHLQAAAQLKPDWRFACYADSAEMQRELGSLSQLSNVSFRRIDEFAPEEADIVHICDPMSIQRGFDSPMRVFKNGRRFSATFYDLIPLHLYFKAWSEALRRHYLLRLEQLVRGGATFLAISEYTGRDLIRQARISAERVKVVMAGLNSTPPPTAATAVTAAQTLERLGICKPYFLHVGALDPHKNFETSAAAFRACRQEMDARLVVVGQKTGELARHAAHCAASGQRDIIFTGYLLREELDLLYQEAVALLFMSRFEGFGFPVLEAMAAGCPVIASRATSIPEVAGDAAILLEPGDMQGVRRAMQYLMVQPEYAETLRRSGRQQAAKFTWEKTAAKTVAVWEGMLSAGAGFREPAAPPAAVFSPHPGTRQPPLRVLLDISVLGLSRLYESSRTGVFRVVENLARGLADSPEIELGFCSTQHLIETAPHTAEACRSYLAAAPELRHVPFHDELPEADIFHSPFHALPDRAIGRRRFLTVYDLIPWLHPQFFKGKPAGRFDRLFAGIRPDDRFLCISHSTRSDLCRHLEIGEERTVVTQLAADPELFQLCRNQTVIEGAAVRYGIPPRRPYFLSLCTLEPRKNLDGVLRGFAHLIRSGRAADLVLVLVGTPGWNVGGIVRVIQQEPALHQRVILTGFVADADLAALYSGAVAFVYMSHYEGFGLPPLEAMQCGTPVIVSDNSSLPEVVGDAGILLDSRDGDGLALAMNEVAVNADLRAEMARRAIRRAALFSWKRCVRETIDAYLSAAKRSRHAFTAESRSAA